MAPSGDRQNIVIIGMSIVPHPPSCCQCILTKTNIGGGIIGCTSAYYLTRHPSYDPSKHKITLLEASKIAGGASGKAGGLLALWAYPSQIVPLSYKLHADLAAEHGGEKRWGYRRIHCGQIDAKGRASKASANGSGKGANGDANGKESVSLQKRDKAALSKLRAAGLPEDLDWIAPESARAYSEMGDPNTTAQVHPLHFTTAMADMAREAGVTIIEGAHVDNIDREGESVKSVTWKDVSSGEKKTTPASSVVLAAGPWTSRLLKSAPIGGLRAHSVTIRPKHEVSGYALFTEISLPTDFHEKRSRGQRVAPEIYARPFNEVYACGDGDELVPLPDTTSDVETDLGRCQDVVDYVSSISDELRDGEVTARQACYLPVSRGGKTGGPWIGEVKECKGLIIASGHSCWGIQNGPGTGKCVSEIVLDGMVKSAQLGMIDPARGM